MPKPTYEQLISYAAGNLPPDVAESVSASVVSDPAAAAVVNAWRSVHRLVSSDDSVEPTASALARAKAVFHGRPALAGIGASVASWMGAVDRLVARVIYDSRLQPATVRSGDADDRIMLTIDTDDGEVDVHAQRQAGSGQWRIMGQIAGSVIADREVALVTDRNAAPAGVVTSDARGAFSLEVSPGEYELLMRRGEGVTLLAPLSLP